jgi:hypothetical protein
VPTYSLEDVRINDQAKILVVVTTCSRPRLAKMHLEAAVRYLREIDNTDFVLAIDGLSAAGNKETLEVARSAGVNCVISERPEGVGISKNRVMGLLGGYDYYFFLDDDVEVRSSRLFSEHIELCHETGIHHFCLHDPNRLVQEKASTHLANGQKIRHAMYGGAAVNFFTREALERVGGWHLAFAKLRRGGHTEHSYRIHRSGLCPAPFNLADRLADSCIWKNPSSVISPRSAKAVASGIFELERDLITEQIEWYPFCAGSPGRLVTS